MRYVFVALLLSWLTDVRQVPTLTVCFRKSAEPNTGWPPVDQPAYDFFEKHRNGIYMVKTNNTSWFSCSLLVCTTG